MIFIKADIQTFLVYPNYILQFYTDVLRIFQNLQRYIPRTYLGSIFAMWVDIKRLAYSSVVHINLMLCSLLTLRKLGILRRYIITVSHGLCLSGLLQQNYLFKKKVQKSAKYTRPNDAFKNNFLYQLILILHY